MPVSAIDSLVVSLSTSGTGGLSCYTQGTTVPFMLSVSTLVPITLVGVPSAVALIDWKGIS